MRIERVEPCMPGDGRGRPQAVAEAFGHNLRHYRRAAGLTQEELAARASLHRTEVSMLEGGTRLARVDTMIKLAAALSVSPMKLLGGISWSLEAGFMVATKTGKPLC